MGIGRGSADTMRCRICGMVKDLLSKSKTGESN